MSKLKAHPEWLKANAPKATPIGVDREARVIRGFLVAEEGPLRSEGRGEFTADGIKQIAELMAAEPKGLKSRFAHPTLSSDGLGKFLGRAVDPQVTPVVRNGELRAAVRADLHLSETAFEGNPNGNLGEYLMDLAEEDPDALGASLVIKPRKEYRLDKKGRPLTDEQGNELPPIWHPVELHAVDLVDTGDATRAFLGFEGLPDSVVRQASELLDRQFSGCTREVIRARLDAWLDKYFDMRGIEGTEPAAKPEENKLRRAVARRIRREARRRRSG